MHIFMQAVFCPRSYRLVVDMIIFT